MMIPSQIIRKTINIVVNVIEGILCLRIALKLFGAATSAPFVMWVYQITDPLLKPFSGMFPSPQLSVGYVIDFSSLFALMVYAFIGYILTEATELLMQSKSQPDKAQSKK